MEAFDPISMLVLGLLGTAHCLGMCGPLVIAIPGSTSRFAPHLLYHLGRIATYTAVGAALGLAGQGLAAAGGGGEGLDAMTRVRIGLSLFAAAFLAGFGLFRLGVIREPGWMSDVAPQRLPGFGRVLRAATGKGSPLAMIGVGLALGLLPCGLSYAAFARALPSGGAAAGAILCLAFGLGTLPGLLALGTAASAVARRHQRLFDLLAGMMMLGMGAKLAVDALAVI